LWIRLAELSGYTSNSIYQSAVKHFDWVYDNILTDNYKQLVEQSVSNNKLVYDEVDNDVISDVKHWS